MSRCARRNEKIETALRASVPIQADGAARALAYRPPRLNTHQRVGMIIGYRVIAKM